MALLDTPIRAAVETAIKVLNTKAVLERSQEMYDPETGKEGAVAQSKITVYVSPPQEYTAREVDGKGILRHDVKFMLAAKGLPTGVTEIVPDQYTLLFNSRRFRVVDVEFVDAGDEHAMLVLQCRK